VTVLKALWKLYHIERKFKETEQALDALTSDLAVQKREKVSLHECGRYG
jgi:hypothetical protein